MDTTEYLQSAVKLQTSGRMKEAEKAYLKLIEQNPDHFDALHLLGLIHSSRGENSIAAPLIEKAMKLRPDVAAFHHNIAGIYRQMGRLAESEFQFSEAIRLKPDYGEAYQGLSEMKKFDGNNDAFLAQIENQLSDKNLPNMQQSYLHFAAGKVLGDSKKYASAFSHYQKANKLTERNFNGEAFKQEVKDSLYLFSKEWVDAHSDLGDPSSQPIFIVGMPRSGTTLVEQILSSHSTVFGAGELSDMRRISVEAARLGGGNAIYPNYLSKVEKHRYAEIGKAYLNRVNSLRASKQTLEEKPGNGTEINHIVDKHPLNFRYVGLIFLMFPNAKVIHTRRNPLDTCLSCYFQHFTKGQDYTFNLDTLAEFYNVYRRLMSHWESVFGGRILQFDYEALLGDQEGETRRLLAYCGLEFEPSCLQFHESKREVKTASFLQVRQPLYQSSRGKWENYREELKDFAQAIGQPLD